MINSCRTNQSNVSFSVCLYVYQVQKDSSVDTKLVVQQKSEGVSGAEETWASRRYSKYTVRTSGNMFSMSMCVFLLATFHWKIKQFRWPGKTWNEMNTNIGPKTRFECFFQYLVYNICINVSALYRSQLLTNFLQIW